MLQSLLAWLWAPLALYLLALGLGLLAERIVRFELPNAVLAPFGLAVAIVLAVPIYRLGAGAAVVTPLLALLAVAGAALARRDLRERLNPGPAGLAALGAYALYMAPVLLSGHWTWPGYNFVNDTAANFLFADLLEHHGLALPGQVDSATEVIQALPETLGYPVGAHSLLATLRPLTGAPLAAVYQPAIGAVAGLAAMSLAHLARRSGLPANAAAAAGFLGVGAALLYRYALHGGIKEVVVVALLATATAVGLEAAASRLSTRGVVLFALCLLPLVLVFGAAGGPYALVVGLLVLAAALAGRNRPSAAHVGRVAAVGAAVALLAALPTLSETVSFGRSASQSFASEGGASTAYLGQLLRPLPAVQAAGVWFARDYRVPADPGWGTLNGVAIALTLALALIGIGVGLWRRRPAAVVLFAAAALPAAVFAPRLSPYADAKLLVILTPAVVLMAAIGAFALISAGRLALRVAGLVGAVLLTVAVLYSDALGYRVAQLAPPDRVAAMEDAAAHARGGGLWLVNEWEEYAKYFMRGIKVNPAFEAISPKPAELRNPRPIFGRYYDLDELTLPYVQSFPGIIKRRSPSASRPPASFELVYSNRYYEVWRRRSEVRVIEHLGLQHLHEAADQPACARVRRLARRARPSDRLMAAARPPLALLDPLNAGLRPKLWVRNVNAPGTVVPVSPGDMRVQRRTRGGRYRVWIRGSFGRPTSAFVDGREIGAADEVNTPGQWVEVGELQLAAGEHEIELVRPDSKPGPGDAYRGELGPVALEPARPAKLVTVAPGQASELCGREWDWIELTRP
jgi:hypothetical protein